MKSTNKTAPKKGAKKVIPMGKDIADTLAANPDAPKEPRAGLYPSDRGKVVKVYLNTLSVRHAWNGRTQADTEREVETTSVEKNAGVGGIQQSLQARGQDDPVTVRYNPTKTADKLPYDLVVGFRRVTALQRIAKSGGVIAAQPDWTAAEPYVLAYVIDMTEKEAVELNGRENIGREDLSPPDASFVIARMGKQGMTDVQIAESLGKTQGYVSKLHRAAKADDKVVALWRAAAVPLTVDQMGVVAKKSTPEEQLKTYNEIANAKKGGKGGEDTPAQLFESAQTNAKRIGHLLGALEATGAATVGDGEADTNHFEKHLPDFVKLPKGDNAFNAVQLRTLAELLKGCYDSTMKVARAEDKAREHVDGKGKAASGKKGAKGATPN